MHEVQTNAPPRALLPLPPGMGDDLPPLSYEPEAIAERLQGLEPYNADTYEKAIAALAYARQHKLDDSIDKWRELLRAREQEHNRRALEALRAAFARDTTGLHSADRQNSTTPHSSPSAHQQSAHDRNGSGQRGQLTISRV